MIFMTHKLKEVLALARPDYRIAARKDRGDSHTRQKPLSSRWPR